MAGAVQDILFIADFKQGELRNAVIHTLASDPASPVAGQYWYNSTSKEVKYYDGTSVKVLATHVHSNQATLDGITAAYTTAEASKLSGITIGATKTEDSATNGNIKINGSESVVYTHPANHAASVITQDASNRFVTDTEKSTWNAKQAALGFTPENAANKGVANGYASLDSSGLVPSTQIPSSYKECSVVADITARNAISTKFSGMHVWVTDATGDATVSTGSAEYIWTGSVWQKISETEGLDVSVAWANISDKPTSTVANIDSAVSLKHSHTGKNIGYYGSNVGDGAATSFTLTHNLNSANPMVTVRRVASPYDQVLVGNEATDANTVKVYFKDAPTAGQFHVGIYG